MERRSVLMGMAAASFCPICMSKPAKADAHPHWTYDIHDHHGGPDHWAELTPDFKACGLGQQSPIDLKTPIRAAVSDLDIQWKPFPLVVGNNGHTIRMKVPPGAGTLTYEGVAHPFVNFHFHHPSEHLLDGKSFEMEVHFVNAIIEGDVIKSVVALGVFFVPGAENPGLKPVWAAMPKEIKEVPTDVIYDASVLLPANRERYVYEGSLTTPACEEVVRWQVFRTPITASPEQIKAFAEIYPNNARPPQPINRRFVLGNF